MWCFPIGFSIEQDKFQDACGSMYSLRIPEDSEYYSIVYSLIQSHNIVTKSDDTSYINVIVFEEWWFSCSYCPLVFFQVMSKGLKCGIYRNLNYFAPQSCKCYPIKVKTKNRSESTETLKGHIDKWFQGKICNKMYAVLLLSLNCVLVSVRRTLVFSTFVAAQPSWHAVLRLLLCLPLI